MTVEDEEALNVSYEFEDDLVIRQAINEALERLEPEDREMVVLRFVNDEPIAEIARICKMSRFAVYRRLKEAKAKLKELLERGNG